MTKNILRQYFSASISEQELKQWFDPLDIVISLEKKCVTIIFPHYYFSLWFIKTKQQQFTSLIKTIMPEVTVRYLDGEINKKEIVSPPLTIDTSQKEAKSALQKQAYSYQIPEEHIFSTFLVNKKNDFPYAAAQEAVKKTFSPVYFPMVIYGQSGSGKTHLLGAMAQSVIKLYPDCLYYYGSSIVFLEKNTYKNISSSQAFFIDDLQLLNKNHDAQIIFSMFIDEAQLKNRFLVIILDNHPSQCSWLQQKLQMRLTSGLVLELKKPDLDIRHRYISKKNTKMSLSLHKENMLTLARYFQDFRTIDGAINKLKAYNSLVKDRTPDIMEIIKSGNKEDISLTPTFIVQQVSEFYGIEAEKIFGKNRTRKIALARQISMYLCRDLLGIPLVQLGEIFGGRDHSSVLYAINKIKENKVINKETNTDLSKLKKMCLFSSQ